MSTTLTHIIASLGGIPKLKPDDQLTEEEKLALYIAAGHPVDYENKIGEDGRGWFMVIRSRFPFAVKNLGDRYVVAVNSSQS